MSAKPALAFQPAPRPQPRTTPQETERLLAATQDLGFGRATVTAASASAGPAVEPDPPAAPAAPQPLAALPPAAPTPTAAEPAPSVDPRRAPALKFDVPEGVWDELRMQAVRRRVTVKYLVLEALAERGYPVDLSAVPEDGRRLR